MRMASLHNRTVGPPRLGTKTPGPRYQNCVRCMRDQIRVAEIYLLPPSEREHSALPAVASV